MQFFLTFFKNMLKCQQLIAMEYIPILLIAKEMALRVVLKIMLRPEVAIGTIAVAVVIVAIALMQDHKKQELS